MSGAEFFTSKKPAAVFKHGILSRYPVVFAAKTGKQVDGNRVVFLDGYAGRGEYDDGEPGSPLLLSRCADSVSSFRQVHGFFIEQDEDNFLNLTRVLDEKGGTTERTLRHGSVDDHLAEALQVAAGAPLFAFLDPFGPALDFTRLKSMLQSRPPWPPTEVLLHFSILSVARMGGAVRAARERHGDLPEGDRKTAERLSRFLGGDWWQDHFASAGAADDRRATDIAMTVCEIYEQKLTAGTSYKAIRMPVRLRPDHLPKYVLALFTTSSEGVWHFADSLGKAGVEWSVAWQQEESRRREAAGQFDLFSAFGDEVSTTESRVKAHGPHWTKIIASNIENLLDSVGPFRPTNKVLELYGTVLGLASTPHARAAIKALAVDKKVANSGKGDFWKETLRRPA